jgi:hypothetical protein
MKPIRIDTVEILVDWKTFRVHIIKTQTGEAVVLNDRLMSYYTHGTWEKFTTSQKLRAAVREVGLYLNQNENFEATMNKMLNPKKAVAR